MRKMDPSSNKALPSIQKSSPRLKSQSKLTLPVVPSKRSETTNTITMNAKKAALESKSKEIVRTTSSSHNNERSRSQNVNRTPIKSQRSPLSRVQGRASSRFANSPYAAQESPKHAISVNKVRTIIVVKL